MSVDIWVVARGDEFHCRSCVGVTRGKGERQLVSQSVVHCPLPANNSSYPVKEVVAVRKSRNSGVAGHLQVTKNGTRDRATCSCYLPSGSLGLVVVSL